MPQMYHRLINEEDPEDHYNNDLSTFELKNRNKDRKVTEFSEQNDQNKINFIFHTVKPNETLQGIALRYACSVSKLRLYNHLMTDQEFHALTVLKIPVLKNSVLTEAHGGQSAIAPPAFVDDLVDVSDQDNHLTAKTQVVNIGISNYLINNGSEDYKKFLNNLSEDFKEIRKSTLLKIENTLKVPSQTESDININVHKTEDKNTNSSAFLSCDGSDFGIHWRYLIVVLVIVCLLVPSYVLFNLEHHNSTNNHNSV